MPESVSTNPAHGVVVLAAGASKRLGQPKQLLEIDGETLLHRVVRFAALSEPAEIIVVLANGAIKIREAIDDLECQIVTCVEADRGISASLRFGLAALNPNCAGALVVLVDQPKLDAAHLCALRDRWRLTPQHAVASRYAETLGVPALLPRSWFAELMQTRADQGARELLRQHAAHVYAIDAPQLAFDLDSLSDLERWRAQS